jgi:hypothetical protein
MAVGGRLLLHLAIGHDDKTAGCIEIAILLSNLIHFLLVERLLGKL